MKDTPVENQEQLSDEEQRLALAAQWFNQQSQKATSYLAQKGVVVETVFNEECTYVAPLFAIFKIRDKERKKYWVIAGDLPTDFATDNVAKDAKNAIRHFSLQWQMRAENMIRVGIKDTVQRDFAQMLVTKAEAIYPFVESEALWKKQQGA
ncbi:DUF4826 family protein [Alteromonas sp. a30]|uniref:DUF4826 family protein n=1 Tax=Alteromonas sp. a30 TaxID=2730917 RepID=UPI00228118CE|nr:DUF4826 family protein [Alteromonas sp. a30]MCY7293985.1 DUF4826 family protein [Alteromonas sp. a30]